MVTRAAAFAPLRKVLGATVSGGLRCAHHHPDAPLKDGAEMANHTVETSPQAYARIGGVLYLIIIVAGLFGEAFVRDKLSDE
ncbi:MAG: hypothetical protein ACREBU_05365 [Nitrososphaera sp.]